MTGIARYLADKGLSQKELARLTGISETSISRYVSGEQFPRRKHLVAISEATAGSVSANDFLPTVPSPPLAPVHVHEGAEG